MADFVVKCSGCGYRALAGSEEAGAEIARAHQCAGPRSCSVFPRAEPSALEALAKLRAYVDSAVELSKAWEKLGSFDVLSENVSDDFVEFGEQLEELVAWRDRVARALGEPEGCGKAEERAVRFREGPWGD